MEDKIIVSNRKALVKKYKKKGFNAIQKALDGLIIADKKRQITTRVIFLDEKKAINPKNPRQNKKAIDSVFKKFKPHYLMILGADDVIPHQDIVNLVRDRNKDPDDIAWSDLPYACDAPYSRDPAKFVGPTRVVGRLPDLVAASKPNYLISLIKTAAKYKKRKPKEYAKYFGLSAEVWELSTEMSISNTFADANKLLLSPSAGPKHSKKKLQKRMHFINCHGGSVSPEFAGQRGEKFYTTLTTKSIQGKILEGTIASVECCYGAELYNSDTLGIDIPICQSYLKQGAYGYHGSTTIAYGPVEGNGAADLICQYFLQNVLKGASIGRAALTARLMFVEKAKVPSPTDYKTLSQFILLGDPSIHPVTKLTDAILPKGVTGDKIEQFSRIKRRMKMKELGDSLKRSTPTASKQVPTGKLSRQEKFALSKIAKEAGLSKLVLKEVKAFAVKETKTSQKLLTNEVLKVKAFAVKETKTSQKLLTKGKKISMRYLMTMGFPKSKKELQNKKIHQAIAIEAKEINGRIVDYRIYHQR